MPRAKQSSSSKQPAVSKRSTGTKQSSGAKQTSSERAGGNPKRKAASSKKVVLKPFRFLDLETEIRVQIYELVFAAPRGFVRFFDKNEPDSTTVKRVNVKINLLFTCHQIYNEAMPTLYSVNNFCIMPLMSTWNDAANRPVQLPQNTTWLKNAPREGLNAVQKIELRLPLPKDMPILHVQDMSKMFPCLKTMTLFVDSELERSLMWRSANVEEDRTYYHELQKLLPHAQNIILDLKWLGLEDSGNGPRVDKNLASSIRAVFSSDSETKVEDGRSIFTLNEERYENKFYENQDVVSKHLLETIGPETEHWEFELGYWGLRGEGGFGEDSGEEDMHFNNWSLENEAARTIAWFTGDFGY